LKSYYSLKKDRTSKIKDIITQFGENSFIKYSLDLTTSLILTKDERSLNTKRRFKNSPFPKLSNIEYFSSSAGDWDQELLSYGIQTRSKTTNLNTSLGIRIHLIKIDSVNCRGNRYLNRQYNGLKRKRDNKDYLRYWQHCWTLMLKSKVFRQSCLNSWLPTWYKTLKFKEVSKILNGLNPIINLKQQQTLVKNVWIESPLGKWRQLGIPNKTWRLYLHILNMFISYLYSPYLDPEIYDGFIYERGCKSWWETVLWSPLLENYNWLIEVDFSSGFPNLNLHSVSEALKSDGLIPLSIINLILTHLKSPLQESKTFPTLETFIENEENRNWRISDRSVPMGLGISPILYVITLNWAFRKLQLNGPDLKSKWYADDGSLYFNTQWLLNFPRWSGKGYYWILKEIYNRRNPILSYFNDHSLFKWVGLRFDSKKSGWIRIWGIWIKPYKSLGLSLYTSLNYLQQLYFLITQQPIPLSLKGSTRGRGANPLKKKSSTLPSSKELFYLSKTGGPNLDLMTLIRQYKPYFGLFQSKLYNSSDISNYKFPKLIYKSNSLLGILFKQNINKELPKLERLTLYNSGSKCNSILLNLEVEINSSLSFNLYKSLKRCKVFLENDNPQILKVDISNPLKKNNKYNLKEDDYFKKYSELNISIEKQQRYKQKYEFNKMKTELLN